MKFRRLLGLASVCVVGLLPSFTFAQRVFEPEFNGYSWLAPLFIAPGANGGVDMAHLPDGRIIIAKKHGQLQMYDEDLFFEGTLLDIADEVSRYGDAGLMNVLVDPDLENNPYIYVGYSVETDPANPDTKQEKFARISRFLLDENDNYSSIVDDSEEILLGETWGEGILQDSIFHISGEMSWGNDGTLLSSTGDSHQSLSFAPTNSDSYGPGRFDPALDIGPMRAQTLDNYNGKIIRIDRHTGLGLPSNPFYDGDPDSVLSRIWAYGLREPWRYHVVEGTGSFDPTDGLPGRMIVGDVGIDRYEEINETSDRGGDNFGWPFYEGDFAHYNEGTYSGPVPYLQYEDTKPPSMAISQNDSLYPSFPALVSGVEMTSITGGFVYNQKEFNPDGGTPYSELIDGKYFFVDWADEKSHPLYLATFDESDVISDIQLMATGDIRPEASNEGIVDLSFNPHTGYIYALTYWRVYRLEYDPSGAPPIAAISADKTSGIEPLTVNFDASDSLDLNGGTLSYEWSVDGSPAVSTSTDPTYQFTFPNNQDYTMSVIVTSDSNNSSSTASIDIHSGNIPPIIELIEPGIYEKYPTDGTRVPVEYLGTVSDPDGVTTPSVLWTFSIATKNGENLHTYERRTDLNGTVLMGTFDQPAWHDVVLQVTDDRGETVSASTQVFQEDEGPIPMSSSAAEWLMME